VVLFNSPTFSFRRGIVVVAIIAAIAPTMPFGAFLLLRLTDNIHVIELGTAYRSGWLWPGELAAVIEQYRIQSIISLVPPAPPEYRYRDELAVSEIRSLARYEMPLSSTKELTSCQLRELLALLRKAPKPVLIQSASGADRSGLAATMFEYAIALRPAEEAQKQLSIRYGHLPLLWSGTEAMDASFRKFMLEFGRDVPDSRHVRAHSMECS
jgi:hypothetical protein